MTTLIQDDFRVYNEETAINAQGKENFIMAFNSMLKGEYKLTSQEFYLYSIMYIHHRKYRTITTSVDFINQTAGNRFNNRDNENKTTIRKMIISMIKKGIFTLVTLSEDYDLDKIIKNNTLLKLDINDMKLSRADESDDNIRKNFTTITTKEFYQFEKIKSGEVNTEHNDKDLMIYLHVFFFIKSRKEELVIYSYRDFANLLQIDRSTANTKVNNMVKNKMIYKNTGAFHDNLTTQDTNEYSLAPIKFEDKSIRQKTIDKAERERKGYVKPVSAPVPVGFGNVDIETGEITTVSDDNKELEEELQTDDDTELIQADVVELEQVEHNSIEEVEVVSEELEELQIEKEEIKSEEIDKMEDNNEQKEAKRIDLSEKVEEGVEDVEVDLDEALKGYIDLNNRDSKGRVIITDTQLSYLDRMNLVDFNDVLLDNHAEYTLNG